MEQGSDRPEPFLTGGRALGQAAGRRTREPLEVLDPQDDPQAEGPGHGLDAAEDLARGTLAVEQTSKRRDPAPGPGDGLGVMGWKGYEAGGVHMVGQGVDQLPQDATDRSHGGLEGPEADGHEQDGAAQEPSLRQTPANEVAEGGLPRTAGTDNGDGRLGGGRRLVLARRDPAGDPAGDGVVAEPILRGVLDLAVVADPLSKLLEGELAKRSGSGWLRREFGLWGGPPLGGLQALPRRP